MITAIILSYNEKEYLETAYTSCKDQTCSEVEIIFADDGSSDGSIELIEKICGCDPRATYFVMERNVSGGVIASLRVSELIRRALEIAKGEYCVILSGDDSFCDNTKFETAISFLDTHEDYYSVASGFKTVYPDKEIVSYPYIPSNPLFFGCSYLHISCFVFRKPCKEMLLDHFIDDTGFVYVLSLAGKIKVSYKITFAYFQRESSIVHSMDLVEWDIVELMLLQDFLNYKDRTGLFYRTTITKMLRSFVRCMKHRSDMRNPKYKKFFEMSSKSNHDLIGEIAYKYDDYTPSKKLGFNFSISCKRIESKFYSALFWTYKIISTILVRKD